MIVPPVPSFPFNNLKISLGDLGSFESGATIVTFLFPRLATLTVGEGEEGEEVDVEDRCKAIISFFAFLLDFFLGGFSFSLRRLPSIDDQTVLAEGVVELILLPKSIVIFFGLGFLLGDANV